MNLQAEAASGTGVPEPDLMVSSDWKTLLNRAQEPASYAPAGSREETSSLVPTRRAVPLPRPSSGSSCQAPTAATPITSPTAMTFVRTDFILDPTPPRPGHAYARGLTVNRIPMSD